MEIIPGNYFNSLLEMSSVHASQRAVCINVCSQCRSQGRGRGGGGGGGPPDNYGGNKSINRLEVTTDQCSALDLDFCSLDNY